MIQTNVMKYIIPFFILFISCNTNSKSHESNATSQATIKDFGISYDSLKQEIKEQKSKLKNKKTSAKAIANEYVTKNLLSLFPYWYGTKWNFYGTSEIPQQGTIACGYFVTTLLRDAGLKINRVKLAQQASSIIIQSVCDKDNIKTFSNVKNEYFFDYIKRQGKSLYVVGLDFHTGFIYFDGDEIYFIQSKYYDEVAVVKEVAVESNVLLESKFKMLGRVDNSEKVGNLFKI